MWIYLLQGIGFGFAAASQPGPLQTYLISLTMTRGWRKALPAALSPLVSDGPIIALCLLVLSQVPAWMQRVLHIAGGLFILYLAWGAYRSWVNFEERSNPAAVESQSLLKGALTNALSPGPYIYWTLVTGPVLVQGWRQSPWNGAGFLAGFYLALVGSLVAIVLVFGLAARIGPKASRTMVGLSSLALVFFGLYQLWQGVFPG